MLKDLRGYMKEEYQKIETPMELLKWMSKNIGYGYITKEKEAILPNQESYQERWFQEYRLQDAEEVLKTGIATCWDQVELERDWFLKHGYAIKTFVEMVSLEYSNPYPTHTFLVYQDEQGNWNWFENADINHRGIYKFETLEECLKKVQECYCETLKEYKISKEELSKIIMTEYEKPASMLACEEYLNFVVESKKVM